MTIAIAGRLYVASPIPAGEFGSAACRLEKAGSALVYDLVRTGDGLIECDCWDFIARHAGLGTLCKHGRALVAHGLMVAPNPQSNLRQTID